MSQCWSDLGRAPRLVAAAALALLGACTVSGPRAPEVQPPGAASAPAAEPAPEPVRRAHEAALAALDAGERDEARRLLEALTREHPGYAAPHVNLAIVYDGDGRGYAARAALQAALEADPGHPAANNRLGMLLRREGEFAAAEAAYRRALETDPGYALAHHNLGVLLDLYLHRREEALNHYERYQALIAEPDSKVAGWIVDLRRRLGAAANGTARVAQEDAP